MQTANDARSCCIALVCTHNDTQSVGRHEGAKSDNSSLAMRRVKKCDPTYHYAMFYAAQALLKSEGIEVTKHSAVESAFGYHFVKTGRIDRKYHRMLITARKIREIADYDIDEEIVEPTATVKIEEGREFVTEVKQYLGLES